MVVSDCKLTEHLLGCYWLYMYITKNVYGYNFTFISGVPCVSSPNGVFELKFYFFMLNCVLYLTFHFGLNGASNLS